MHRRPSVHPVECRQLLPHGPTRCKTRSEGPSSMSRLTFFIVFFAAVFFQSGAYGLTFLLPRLFAGFGANEVVVGQMLLLTAGATLISVYFSGHLSDLWGRVRTMAIACVAIAGALALFGIAQRAGVAVVCGSILLGFGWGLTYTLGPVVLTRIVPVENRVRYFTLLSVFVMAGFGLSPVLTAMLERAGYAISDAFLIVAGLSLVSAVLFQSTEGALRRFALQAGPEVASRITLASLGRVFTSPARVPVVMVLLGASVFAGLNNFQTVFADARGLDYATFFLTYTVTVIVFRLVLATFMGGARPYLTIAALQYIMAGSVVLFMYSGDSLLAYIATAVLFGIGYGVSYPILVSVTSADAHEDLGPQTLQLFALSYFIGIFGFPLIAGWLIVVIGTTVLLWLIFVLALIEASLALCRGVSSSAR